MPPRRKRVRDASHASPDPKQKTIADFFSKRTGPSPISKPRAPPVTTPPPVQPERTRSSSTRHVRRLHFDTEAHPTPSSPPSLTTRAAACRTSVARALEASDACERPSRPRGETMLMELDDEEDDESEDDNPADVLLTQEELEVHDQLQALECSRDGPSEPVEKEKGLKRGETCVSADKDVDMERGGEQIGKRSCGFSPPKRQRPAVKEAVTAANRTDHMRDSDDDETPPRLPTASSDSDSDDNDELFRHQPQPLRRSTRFTRGVSRFDPTAGPAPGQFDSLLGTSLSRSAASRSTSNALKMMMRERKARAAEEEQIETMRQDVARGTGQADRQEEEFATMANEEDRREKRRLANLEKYDAPLPLFTGAFQMPQLSRKYWVRGKGCVHHLHDLLLETMKGSQTADLAMSLLPVCISKMLESSGPQVPFSVANILFHLVIYDDLTTESGRIPRDDLVESLADIMKSVQYQKAEQRLPSFVATLQSFGAVFDSTTRSKLREQRPANMGPLDSEATKPRESVSNDFEKVLRNLRRACLFTARRIQDGAPLHHVIGSSPANIGDNAAILYGLGVCTRVLLSTFGSRLAREIGPVIVGLLNRIDTLQWPEFRGKAAKHVLSLTERLGLHVELVSFLLPYSSRRARFLSLDIAYLSLMQWCEGPGDNPTPRDIQSFFPPREEPAHDASYCLSDVITLVKSIPELCKETDVEWACGISKILKQALADFDILKTRRKGEIGTIYQLLQKLRTCSHRMVFDVPVQDMRLALDALLASMRDLLGESRAIKSEINPRVRFEKKQMVLTEVMGQAT